MQKDRGGIRGWARLCAGLMAMGIALAATAAATVPGGRPAEDSMAKSTVAVVPAKASGNALTSFFSATGRLYLSVDGNGTQLASQQIQVDKRRDSSVVRQAFLLAASTGFDSHEIVDGELTLAGSPVDVDETTLIASSIRSFNVRADVTAIVKPLVDAAPPGRVSLQVGEAFSSLIDGEVLAVVFDDGAEPEGSVLLFYGAQAVGGDSFNILLAEPIEQAAADQQLRFSLGISFGFQTETVTGQSSLIDINGVRLTSAAGGQDDGDDSGGADGRLITVGGLDDRADNPADPAGTAVTCGAPPRCDDELYDLKAVLADGTTAIRVDTRNPSNDDNIFFAAIEAIGTAALVGEGVLVSPAEATLPVGAAHEIVATVQDDDGQPIANRAVTFTVTSGPNTGLSTVVNSDAGGLARFSITSATQGTDSVVASIVDAQGDTQTSNVATVTWLPPPPQVQFSATDFRVDENAGTASITLTRTGDDSDITTVQLTSADGSAEAGADYAAVSLTVTFDEGENSKTVTVDILDDTLVEPDETLVLTLSEPARPDQVAAVRAKAAGSPIGSPSSATLTIVDDDVLPPPTVSFATTQSSTAEGLGELTVIVTLSAASTQTVSVPLVVAGSAQSGADFGALPQSISFAAGTTSVALGITIVDDAVEEGEENIVLTLGTSEQATPGAQTTHTVLIAASDAVVMPPPVDPEPASVTLTKTSGGGALSPLLLAVLVPLAMLRRRRCRAIAAVLLAACAGTAVAAEESLWYGGVQIGPAATSYGSGNLTRKLQDQGHDVTAEVDAHDFGGAVHIGRRVAPNTSFELGLLYFGEYKARVGGQADVAELQHDLMAADPVGGSGFSAAVRYEIPLTQQLVLLPRIGAFVWISDNEIELEDGSTVEDTRHGTGGRFDATIAYRLTPRLSVGAGGGVLLISPDDVIRQGFVQVEVGF